MAAGKLHINLYGRKQRWKIALVILALGIIGASLTYSNLIVNEIRQEERKKIELWAEAIRKKAKLVNYTSRLFDKLREEEHKKVNLMASAWKIVAKPDFLEDYTFITDVIGSNTEIPVIIVDENWNYLLSRNIDTALVNDKGWVKREIELMRKTYDPIEVPIAGSGKQMLLYKDSHLFSELQRVMKDLIKSFISEVVVNSASVPVIYTDHTQETVIDFGNIDSTMIEDPAFVQMRLETMRSHNDPILVDLGNDQQNFIFYEDSFLLTQLQYYPYVVFFFIIVFLLVAYLMFSTFRKAEQNQVWVGLAKETAHQLGTPLSSLMAWLELLRSKAVDSETIDELEKDVKRLETITDRFSKIGSQSKLTEQNVEMVLNRALDYIKNRVSQKVNFSISINEGENITALINPPLFEWVVENLCKNAVDAMEGQGNISVYVMDLSNRVVIDVADTGSGIPPSKHKTIFEPGYSTKTKGWGLGLSLAKRIIENYHQGKIYVKSSEAGKGTTFRISLPKG